MLKKRIIPCLDIRDGRTVKGVRFVGIRDAGDPIALAGIYADQGADELAFLDITATVEGRGTFAALVKDVAHEINIPFSVGGGIRSIDDVSRLLHAGADKVSINSAAVRHPELIGELARSFGSQCVIVAIDARMHEGEWRVYLDGGRTPTDIRVEAWAMEAYQRGAGEILLTSMEHDGTKQGFALALTKEVRARIGIPVIASGGAGTIQHFIDLFRETETDAALAASIFHFQEIPIPALKAALHDAEIPVR